MRVEYRSLGGSWTDVGWIDTPNDGDEQIAFFSREASAGAGADRFREGIIEVRYYGRSPGFNDTLLAEFSFRIQAYADATDF